MREKEKAAQQQRDEAARRRFEEKVKEGHTDKTDNRENRENRENNDNNDNTGNNGNTENKTNTERSSSRTQQHSEFPSPRHTEEPILTDRHTEKPTHREKDQHKHTQGAKNNNTDALDTQEEPLFPNPYDGRAVYVAVGSSDCRITFYEAPSMKATGQITNLSAAPTALRAIPLTDVISQNKNSLTKGLSLLCFCLFFVFFFCSLFTLLTQFILFLFPFLFSSFFSTFFA